MHFKTDYEAKPKYDHIRSNPYEPRERKAEIVEQAVDEEDEIAKAIRESMKTAAEEDKKRIKEI